MKKKLVFVIAALLGMSAVTIQPASADITRCKVNLMCFWHDQSYEGTYFSLSSSDGDLGSNSDEAHSLYNRTASAWVVYDDKNFADDRQFCVLPGHRSDNLGTKALKFGDTISSAQNVGKKCPANVPQI